MPGKRSNTRLASASAEFPDVVCFGLVTPGIVMVVDELPEHNTGAIAKSVCEFISDDAALISTLLRGWDIRSGLIGTALGDDDAGRKVVCQLQALGVMGEFRLHDDVTTPLEVNVSDRSGARTYFWQRPPELLATLDTADLSLLEQARLLYVDWYDGDHILRPMQAARELNIPVFLNLEYGHDDAERLAEYAQYATVCQVVTDEAQRGGDPSDIAQKVLAAGVQTVMVTLGAEGCLVAHRNTCIRAWAPVIDVVDGCGAGATFSAGVIFGYLQGWDLGTLIRFATAAASLKCTVLGPRAFPIAEIHQLASRIKTEMHEIAIP